MANSNDTTAGKKRIPNVSFHVHDYDGATTVKAAVGETIWLSVPLGEFNDLVVFLSAEHAAALAAELIAAATKVERIRAIHAEAVEVRS